MNRTFQIVWLGAFVLFAIADVRGEAFETSFTFQSQLDKNGSPLSGATDCRFELFDVESGGTALGSLFLTADVTDGLATVKLDFGVDIFDGQSRWLEVSLRHPHDPTDTAPYTTLSPRQSISPIPYALQTRGIFVDQNEKVSIGVPTNRVPISKVRVRGAVADAIALLAESPATTGDAVGIKGTTASDMGRGVEGIGPGEGVRGKATAAAGATVGVKGTSDSVAGTGVVGEAMSEGVRGLASAMAGIARGVCGVSESTSGEGVLGHAMAKTGSTTGVKGVSDSPDGKGVVGEAVGNGVGVAGMAEMEGVRGEATMGTGVCGMSMSTTGLGVLGHASAGIGSTVGEKGMSDSTDGTGVVGEAMTEGVRGMSTATTGSARGVCGVSASSSGEGVLGHATSGFGTPVGVRGVANSGGGFGVRGESPNGGFGVWGETAGTGSSVVGVTNATGIGVDGRSLASTGNGIGVSGFSNAVDGTGVSGSGGKGVSGVGMNNTAPSFGTVGQSLSLSHLGAGVLAQGNGASASGFPQAAALQISEGAITVGGGIRPAGRRGINHTWGTVTDCAGDTIGYIQDVDLTHDLITPDSIIWATVETVDPDVPGRVFTLHIFDKQAGSVKFRVTALGRSGPMCTPPSSMISRYVNYLIINPLSE